MKVNLKIYNHSLKIKMTQKIKYQERKQIALNLVNTTLNESKQELTINRNNTFERRYE